MMPDPKHVWTPGPLTPEIRKVVGAHERLHLAVIKDISVEQRDRSLAAIVAFENGESDTPYLDGSGVFAKDSKWVQMAETIDSIVRDGLMSRQPAKKYFVHWGWMHQRTEEFTDFERALAYYADHKGGPCGARVTGEGYDADHDGDGFREVSDGLTDDERERLEEMT